MKKNILIWTKNVFNIGCGGLNVQYELCRVLKEMGVNVKIHSPMKVENSIFNDYYEDNEFDLNETVVIYGETIDGNPLNAPYVVRWILAPIGMYFTIDQCNTWGKNDLVYYFNSESKIKNNPDKVGNIFKMLPIIYISKYVQNNNIEIRDGFCYTIRKGYSMHKQLVIKHPPNSFEILNNCGFIESINIFNKYKYFLSYDPLSFYTIIAAMCGCISVVVKVDGLSKEDWLNTTACAEYFKETEEPIYGVAYGEEEIEFAKSTLHLVEKQWKSIQNYCKKKYIEPFICDINNFEKQINTLENNFY